MLFENWKPVYKSNFLNSVFKHPKMRNVTQTLLKKRLLPNMLFFGPRSFQWLNTKKFILPSQKLLYLF